ncbi:MAG: diguanylate cyclase [Pseudomonas monteilii]|nr:MAG: diguanylate cyclase [Pseudomonas monteilii]
MGAGLPANTGAAGAMHRVTFFAGDPAPTLIAPAFRC